MSKLNVQKMDNKSAATPKEESLIQKAGDAIERVGEKLKDMGAEKLGNAVYQAGNKLEHSEQKNKKH